MGLSRIRGQDRALRSLGSAMEQDRLHHGYRFEGPDGVGKELTALGLAKVLNCTSGLTTTLEASREQGEVTLPDFCDKCLPCRKIEAGNHPDVRLLTREKNKATITIGQIRELHGYVLYPPSEGKAKVVILRDADRVTEEAANAFLKMLEEPPPRLHFFLVTSRPHRLLPTIMSRTIPVRFSPLSTQDMIDVLGEILPDRRGEELAQVAAMAGGSVAAAVAHVSESFRETLDQVMALDRAYAGGVDGLVELLDDMALGREETTRILAFLEMWYRDVAFVGVTGSTQDLMLMALRDEIARRAESLPAATASAMALRIPEHRALLENYVNPRMVLERLYMEFRREDLLG